MPEKRKTLYIIKRFQTTAQWKVLSGLDPVREFTVVASRNPRPRVRFPTCTRQCSQDTPPKSTHTIRAAGVPASKKFPPHIFPNRMWEGNNCGMWWVASTQGFISRMRRITQSNMEAKRGENCQQHMTGGHDLSSNYWPKMRAQAWRAQNFFFFPQKLTTDFLYVFSFMEGMNPANIHSHHLKHQPSRLYASTHTKI